MSNALAVSAGSPQKVLDRAKAAIKAMNYSALVKAAEDIGSLAADNESLVEPLIVIANRLGRQPAFVPAAVAVAQVAARSATDTLCLWGMCVFNPLRTLAVESILDHVDALAATDKSAAVDAARFAIEYAPPVYENGAPLRARAAESILNHVDELTDASAAVAATRLAIGCIPRDSALEQRAVMTWAKHVKALAAKDLPSAIDCASEAASPHHGSVLERQGVTLWAKFVDALGAKNRPAAFAVAQTTVDDSPFARVALGHVAALKVRKFCRDDPSLLLSRRSEKFVKQFGAC